MILKLKLGAMVAVATSLVVVPVAAYANDYRTPAPTVNRSVRPAINSALVQDEAGAATAGAAGGSTVGAAALGVLGVVALGTGTYFLVRNNNNGNDEPKSP